MSEFDPMTSWIELMCNEERWNGLPRSIRREVERGIAKIRRIHAQIGADAAVSVQPPVRIVDEIWISPDGKKLIHGCAAGISIEGENFFGAKLPVSVALFPDSRIIRGILVHEFAHCYNYMTQVINARDSGKVSGRLQICPDSEDFFNDQDHDDALLVNPSDWFGQTDVELFLTWDDPKFSSISKEKRLRIVERLEGYFPIITPDLDLKCEGIAVPQEAIDHIQKLRGWG